MKIQKLLASYRGPFEGVLVLERASTPDERVLDHFVGARRPVIVRRYLAGTPLDGLTFDDVRARAGHLLLDVTYKPRLMGIAREGWLGSDERMRLSDYLDIVLASGQPRQDLYTRFRNLRVPREFREALGLIRPPFLAPHEVHLPCIWIGGRGTCSKLHTDPQDNFVLAAIGSRRFWLHAPSELEHLQTESVLGTAFLRSPLDPRLPSHPAHCVAVDLEPGDLLMLPLGWAHFVECTTPSFSYNYWLAPRETPFFMRTALRG